MIFFTSFAASFGFIFLRAFQQLNVVHNNHGWVVPTSIAMAAAEAVVIVNIARAGWQILLVLCVGVGAGLGSLVAMYLHKRFIRS